MKNKFIQFLQMLKNFFIKSKNKETNYSNIDFKSFAPLQSTNDENTIKYIYECVKNPSIKNIGVSP